MSAAFRRQMLHELGDPEFRRAYVADHCALGLALQIQSMREQRGWTQQTLARKLGTTQSAVSRLEDPDAEPPTVNTLLKIAEVFDVAFVASFLPFDQYLKRIDSFSGESIRALPFKEAVAGLEPGRVKPAPRKAATAARKPRTASRAEPTAADSVQPRRAPPSIPSGASARESKARSR